MKIPFGSRFFIVLMFLVVVAPFATGNISVLAQTSESSQEDWMPNRGVLSPEYKKRKSYAALAFSPSTGAVGWGWPLDTPQDTEKFALTMCGESDCEVVVFGEVYKVGFLVMISDMIGYALGKTYEEAKHNAANLCLENSQDLDSCTVIFIVNNQLGLLYSVFHESSPTIHDSDRNQTSPPSSSSIDPHGDEAHWNWEECGDWAGC